MTSRSPLSSHTSAGGDETRARTVTTYDFRRPIQLSREHARLLQLAFEGFARQATTVFTASLRRVCTVGLRGIEQRTYAEYIDSLDSPTYLTTFSPEPVDGTALIEMPLHAAMTCLDHMLGGPGAAQQPQRPLTDIEGAVVRGVVERLLQEMSYSLAGTIPMSPRLIGVEYSPQFAQVGAASDVVVVLTFDLVLGERQSRLTICLPFNGVLPHLTAAAAPAPVSDRELAMRSRSSQTLREQFQTMPVEVAVRFRPTRLHPVDLDDLAVGDVIRLSHPAVAPLEVSTDDTTFAYATPGTKGARLAALVVSTPKETS